MTPYQKRLTPLTKPLAGDMKIRHLAQATIDAFRLHFPSDDAHRFTHNFDASGSRGV